MYALPRPGQVTGASATAGGQTSAKCHVDRAVGRRSRELVPDHALRRGPTAQTPTVISGSPPATSKTITGLTSGTTYRFTVEAMNANGAGPASALTNAVTPAAAVVPSAPSNVQAQPATKSARVTWTASRERRRQRDHRPDA